MLQFFLMYPQADVVTGLRWVEDHKQIATNYLKTWFALDFFSITLVTIDFVSIETGDDPTLNLSALRILRVLRALRLVKLVRLVRASRMFKRWECKIAINYAALALTKSICLVILAPQLVKKRGPGETLARAHEGSLVVGWGAPWEKAPRISSCPLP